MYCFDMAKASSAGRRKRGAGANFFSAAKSDGTSWNTVRFSQSRFSLKKAFEPLTRKRTSRCTPTVSGTPLNHILLLYSRLGGVLQEPVARRRERRYDDAPEKFQQVK
jgi:hypothetical protein